VEKKNYLLFASFCLLLVAPKLPPKVNRGEGIPLGKHKPGTTTSNQKQQ